MLRLLVARTGSLAAVNPARRGLLRMCAHMPGPAGDPGSPGCAYCWPPACSSERPSWKTCSTNVFLHGPERRRTCSRITIRRPQHQPARRNQTTQQDLPMAARSSSMTVIGPLASTRLTACRCWLPRKRQTQAMDRSFVNNSGNNELDGRAVVEGGHVTRDRLLPSPAETLEDLAKRVGERVVGLHFGLGCRTVGRGLCGLPVFLHAAGLV